MAHTSAHIPQIQSIAEIKLPTAEVHHLNNGVKVVYLPGGEQPLVRLDICLDAGRIHEEKKLAAIATTQMLKEGSRRFSAMQVAQIIDEAGAYLTFPFSFDAVQCSLLCLSEQFARVAEVVCSLITSPQFPRNEFELYRHRVIEKLKLDTAQNDVQAYRLFTEVLFGSEHPYGYNSSELLYRALHSDDLHQHHQRCFGSDNLTLFVSGRPPLGWKDYLEKWFGQWSQNTTGLTYKYPNAENATGQQHTINNGHPQSALRLGRRLFPASHPDSAALVLLNAVLGGYYGSRLMKTIREERGLTYGIYSSFETMKHEGYFNISVEAHQSNTTAILVAIEDELSRLQDTLIDHDELTMVKNYLGGYFLSLIDGPFPTVEIMRVALHETGNLYHLSDLFASIRELEAVQLQEVARRYLSADQMTQVIIH